MTPTVAYLASGKLYLKQEGRATEPIESAYGQELIEDAIRRREKNEWKNRSQTGQMMSGGAPWGDRNLVGAETRRIHISGVTRGGRPGELLYALDTDQVGGLFTYDIAQRHEQRLYHNHRFRARHLSRHPEQPLATFSLQQEDGTSAIAVMNLENNDLQLVTEGDSLDESPSWAPGGGSRLVFQSAGLARNQQGALAGVGAYVIQQLDLDRENLSTLLEDDKRDFLLPRIAPDGSLYFLRRPYQGMARASGLHILRDVVMFPIVLLWAVLGFLNFFSTMFAGKPLITSGGVRREGPSPRHMLLWGKLVDAERAERRAKKGEPVALVPDDWELVHQRPEGGEEVISGGVVSYDVCADGSVVYTNGTAVYHREANGRKGQLCEGKLIEHVVVTG
jgi:hypothetical protein